MTKQVWGDMIWCVLYTVVYKLVYTAAESCCDAFPPSIELLGPPPRPPWLPYSLSCNGSSIIQIGVLDRVTTLGNVVPTINTGLATPGVAQTTIKGSGLSPPLVFFCVVAVLCVAFLALFMALRWYKRKHISVKVAPEKFPENQSNYLYNYHIRGKQWRKVDSESDGSVSDFTNSSQKSLITCNAFLVGDRSLSLRQNRKNQYLANSSTCKKLKDGALETAQACQENIEMEPAFHFSDLQGDGSTSSGIGLSQTDLHDLDEGQEDMVEDAKPTALWAITRAPPDGEAEMPLDDTETPRQKHTKTAIVKPMVKMGTTPISPIFSPVKSSEEPKKRKKSEEKVSTPRETLPGMYRSPRSLDPLPAKTAEKKTRTKKKKVPTATLR